MLLSSFFTSLAASFHFFLACIRDFNLKLPSPQGSNCGLVITFKPNLHKLLHYLNLMPSMNYPLPTCWNLDAYDEMRLQSLQTGPLCGMRIQQQCPVQEGWKDSLSFIYTIGLGNPVHSCIKLSKLEFSLKKQSKNSCNTSNNIHKSQASKNTMT